MFEEERGLPDKIAEERVVCPCRSNSCNTTLDTKKHAHEEYRNSTDTGTLLLPLPQKT
jgi:hypothetical protein